MTVDNVNTIIKSSYPLKKKEKKGAQHFHIVSSKVLRRCKSTLLYCSYWVCVDFHQPLQYLHKYGNILFALKVARSDPALDLSSEKEAADNPIHWRSGSAPEMQFGNYWLREQTVKIHSRIFLPLSVQLVYSISLGRNPSTQKNLMMKDSRFLSGICLSNDLLWENRTIDHRNTNHVGHFFKIASRGDWNLISVVRMFQKKEGKKKS